MNCSPCGGNGSASININSLQSTQVPTYDTFSRTLVDLPTTIFTSHGAFGAEYNTIDYRSTGTGSLFIDVSNTVTELTVAHTAGRAIKQSREYLLYLPGKSQIIQFTLTPHYNGTFDNNVAVRAGLYDDYRDKNTPGSVNPGNPLGKEVNQKSMGHFFELSGNQWFVVERTNSPDNVTNVTRVPQSQWNIDTVDGNITTSKSGFVLSNNPTTGILLFLDRQWLGVGMVRMGLYSNGKPIYVHAFQGRTIGIPYTHLPMLPLRWEIERTSTVGTVVSTTMAAICGSAFVGGSYIPYGNLYSLPLTSIPADIPVDQTVRPVLLIRLQQQYCRATLKLKTVDLVNTNTNNAGAGFQISRNPIVVGPAYTWTKHPDPRSMIEYVVFSSPVIDNYTLSSDGYVTRAGYFSAQTQLQDNLGVDDLLTSPAYCSDIYGNADVLCISMVALKSTGGNLAARVNARWIEIA
jgi:hypothetical protein